MAEKKELYGYEEDDILTLEFDDGEEEECGILGVFDALGKEYIALNPLGTEDVSFCSSWQAWPETCTSYMDS